MLAQQPMPSTVDVTAAPSTTTTLRPPVLHSLSPVAYSRRLSGLRPLLAIAAVFLLMLGAVALSLRPQEQQSQPIYLSAVNASPQPEATTSETLLVVPLVDALEPGLAPISGDRVTSWNLYTVEVAPETSAAWDASHAICCPGPRFEYVLAGTYRVRADEPMQVIRASNPDAPTVVPADTEVTLGPGDARITRNTTTFAAMTGEQPLQLLVGFLLIDKPYREPIPTGWILPSGTWQSTDNPASGWSSVPTDLRTLQLRLEKVMLDSNEAFPRKAGVIGQIAVSTIPDSAIASKGDGTVRNLGATPLTAYILTIEPRTP